MSNKFIKSDGDPYYPRSTIRDKKIMEIYNKEKKNMESRNVYFAGRLADYKYINTDEAVEIGLNVAKKILQIRNKTNF